MQKNFSENYRKFGRALSKRFASLGVGNILSGKVSICHYPCFNANTGGGQSAVLLKTVSSIKKLPCPILTGGGRNGVFLLRFFLSVRFLQS
jgi:hypothetical protein